MAFIFIVISFPVLFFTFLLFFKNNKINVLYKQLHIEMKKLDDPNEDTIKLMISIADIWNSLQIEFTKNKDYKKAQNALEISELWQKLAVIKQSTPTQKVEKLYDIV